MSVTHLGCAAEALQYMYIYLSAPLSVSLLLTLSCLCIPPGLCLVVPPQPFFTALNEATAGASLWNRSPRFVTISRLNEGYCLI